MAKRTRHLPSSANSIIAGKTELCSSLLPITSLTLKNKLHKFRIAHPPCPTKRWCLSEPRVCHRATSRGRLEASVWRYFPGRESVPIPWWQKQVQSWHVGWHQTSKGEWQSRSRWQRRLDVRVRAKHCRKLATLRLPHLEPHLQNPSASWCRFGWSPRDWSCPWKPLESKSRTGNAWMSDLHRQFVQQPYNENASFGQ